MTARAGIAAVGYSAVRDRLARVSRLAEARRADGTALPLRPHDCRRLFASELLNNNVPVHVIGALLGHAGLDTVMVYVLPGHADRGVPQGRARDLQRLPRPRQPARPHGGRVAGVLGRLPPQGHGHPPVRAADGDHCSRGLVCLGCSHAQPKRSAAPIFARMLTGHERALARARSAGEPAGQIAARELEIQRISGALRRADELTDDVAAALEAVA